MLDAMSNGRTDEELVQAFRKERLDCDGPRPGCEASMLRTVYELGRSDELSRLAECGPTTAPIDLTNDVVDIIRCAPDVSSTLSAIGGLVQKLDREVNSRLEHHRAHALAKSQSRIQDLELEVDRLSRVSAAVSGLLERLPKCHECGRVATWGHNVTVEGGGTPSSCSDHADKDPPPGYGPETPAPWAEELEELEELVGPGSSHPIPDVTCP